MLLITPAVSIVKIRCAHVFVIMAQAGVAEPNNRIQETQFASEEPDEEQQGPRSNGYGTTNAVPTASVQNSTEPAQKPATGATRALGPDLLRGLLMVLQAIDHSAVSTGAWRHGTGLESEGDGTVVNTWNNNTGWTARMFTHLCAPGFMFLLGMGVVYWGQSRSKLGWSTWRMISHYFIRALVLAIVNEILGLVIARGRFLVLNIVLLALAVNYFLAGLLWLAITASEQALSRLMESESTESSAEDHESQPLLRGSAKSSAGKTSSIVWHAHNIFLLVLAVVTIWWNVWLSRDHGHCTGQSSQVMDIGSAAIGSKTTNLAFDFWFYSVQTAFVVSPFPPLAWLSFAIIGMLYARVVLARPWRASGINSANAAVGVAFAILFVITRLANFGNLSEGCLHMPEHEADPDKNQYLTSFKAFFYVIKYPPDPAYRK